VALRLCALVCALTTMLCIFAVQVAPAAASARCGSVDYQYAGAETRRATRGADVTITALALPEVRRGHVVAWVGVAGAGPGGSGIEGWIQIGLSTFPGDRMNHVYVEFAKPNHDPHYTLVRAAVAPGEHHRFGVRELAHRPGWWRAWLDGAPVSVPIHLRGSHNRWKAQVTAESWNDGSGACNLYAYSFNDVVIASRAAWTSLLQAETFQDPGYRFLGAPSRFVAMSSVPPAGLPARTVADAAGTARP
jgi:hypothetical protein